MSDLVVAESVSHVFGAGMLARTVLRDVSLRLRVGELLLLVGPSGSGKTTLLWALAGLLAPTRGHVHVCGQELGRLSEGQRAAIRRTTLGMVLQRDYLFPALTALENVTEVMAMKSPPTRRTVEDARALLRRLGVEARAEQRPAALSAGERQRVSIARALGGEPRVLLADEPTAALDGETAAATLALIRGLLGTTRGAIVVTHDLRLERWADRVLVLEDGRLRERDAGGAVA